MKDSAFPTVFTTTDNKTHIQLGMTLRDWFAGLAMQGMAGDPELSLDKIPKWSYSLADAMLKARDSQ